MSDINNEDFKTEEAEDITIEEDAQAEECSDEEGTVEESAEAAEAEEETSEDESDEKKKGFFKKDKKDKKDEQIEQLNDQLLRQRAEFVNFRTRSEKEKSQMFDLGAKNIIEKLLPVVDNFERGLVNVKEGDDAFSDGMLMIYRQMVTGLKEAGVEPIEAIGKEFNPDLHNAVMQVESEEVESGFVVAELQKGYTYKDQVVRHSMVSVAQ